MIFENLFAVYYRFMMAQRNFLRKTGLGFFATRNEEWDATAVLAMVQTLSISVIVGWIIKQIGLHLSIWFLFLYLPLFYYLTYLNNNVFTKNRERRRAILENYNNLSEVKKVAWMLFSILVIIIPVYLIIILASSK